MSRIGLGSLLLLATFLLAGCGHSGSRTVSRRWLDCNHYGTPAYVKDRIDVRPHKAHRVATYRWAHVRGPCGPLESTQPVAIPMEFADRANGTSINSTVAATSDGAAEQHTAVPDPQPLPEETGSSDLLPDEPPPTEAREILPRPNVVRRTPARSSWLFRELN